MNVDSDKLELEPVNSDQNYIIQIFDGKKWFEFSREYSVSEAMNLSFNINEVFGAKSRVFSERSNAVISEA